LTNIKKVLYICAFSCYTNYVLYGCEKPIYYKGENYEYETDRVGRCPYQR